MAQPSWSEYRPGQQFPGVIGRTTDESGPAWPQPVRAVAGAPNVLFIVFDDTGFGQFGCYGSPIETPNLDALAAGGLLYNNMHTTALCSPSRSCIITGRNHHANGMAAITELATGYPGYNGQIPFENGFLSEMLLQHGYNTYMVGKWHLMPPNRSRRRARTTGGRWGAVSSGSTGSSAAIRASGIRTWCTTTTRSSRRPGRRRATT
jgi:arylsulfatase A-like enzyme